VSGTFIYSPQSRSDLKNVPNGQNGELGSLFHDGEDNMGKSTGQDGAMRALSQRCLQRHDSYIS